MKSYLLALVRYLRIRIALSHKIITHGEGIFVGRKVSMWAPHHIRLGNHVTISSECHIAANCTIGDYSGLSSRVALIGRLDHDYRTVGVPFRFAPHVASRTMKGTYLQEKDEVTIGEDVWVGHQSILLTGVKVCRGAVVAAGSVVVHDIEPYSIVAGVPARKVGMRFSNEQIAIHEEKIARGNFKHSLRGFDYDLINSIRRDRSSLS
jgi:acetyltransferase-like isoleucine patch superfamily enzyme